MRLDRGPRHLPGVPADLAVLEAAVVGEERRARRPQPEDGVFDHRPARPHRVEEVAEVIFGAVVAGRRRVGLVVARLELRAFGVFRAVQIPAGSVEVVLRYESPAWRRAVLVSGAGGVVMLLLLAWSLLRPRRVAATLPYHAN